MYHAGRAILLYDYQMFKNNHDTEVAIIGGGLAGAEAAWQLARRGVSVCLYEMRPQTQTAVHKSGKLGELVCSNSLKSLNPDSAAGALKYELAAMGSFVLRMALESRVAAGGALAVDREQFADLVTSGVEAMNGVTVVHEEVTNLDSILASARQVIVATGPLTSDRLASYLEGLLDSSHLAFYDAAAPIVTADSLDWGRVFAQSRYGKGDADYLNAPLDRDGYDAFIQALVAADRVIVKDFEKRELFAACQPLEEVARSGHDSLRYGALKPVGLRDPDTGQRPWAVVQLRAENRERTAYNLVGFQTNLKFPEQQRVFRMIPGLEQAEFVRYGVMHRNTFIDSPHVLDSGFSLLQQPKITFAGQLTGTEGYVEAIASGLYAALNCYARLRDLPPVVYPADSAFGSLAAYATDRQVKDYQPMHVNFGIMPPLSNPPRAKRARHRAYAVRANNAIDAFVAARSDLDFADRYTVPFLEQGQE
jgi:methylenetetrahydrofolate--tRNA-(uracil-5-)-methyltransferase